MTIKGTAKGACGQWEPWKGAAPEIWSDGERRRERDRVSTDCSAAHLEARMYVYPQGSGSASRQGQGAPGHQGWGGREAGAVLLQVHLRGPAGRELGTLIASVCDSALCSSRPPDRPGALLHPGPFWHIHDPPWRLPLAQALWSASSPAAARCVRRPNQASQGPPPDPAGPSAPATCAQPATTMHSFTLATEIIRLGPSRPRALHHPHFAMRT